MTSSALESGVPAVGPNGGGALAGVRVVDLSHAIAGAVPGTMLADLGAEVIKIESNAHLDMSRTQVQMRTLGVTTSHPWGLQLLRGKKSMLLNFKSPQGRQVLLDLVAASDVVVENYAAGTLERAGITIDDLKAARPDIIVLSIRGHTNARYASLRHGAPAFQAFMGIDDSLSYGDGPVVVGRPIGDMLAGLYGLVGVLGALARRDRLGIGAHLKGGLNTTLTAAFGAQYLAEPDGRRLAPGPSTAVPHGYFPCQGEERWVAISVANQGEWEAFAQLIGRPDWGRSPEYGDAYRRVKQRPAIEQATEEWTRQRDPQTAARELQEVGIAAQPLLMPADRLETEHFHARRVFEHVEHPEIGPMPLANVVWRSTSNEPQIRATICELGAHTDEILTNVLGRSAEDIQRLRDEGILN